MCAWLNNTVCVGPAGAPSSNTSSPSGGGQAAVFHAMFPTVVQSSLRIHTDPFVLSVVAPIAVHSATQSWSTIDMNHALSPTTMFAHMVNVTESDGIPSMRAERGTRHPA
jgi:hypothetical protein